MYITVHHSSTHVHMASRHSPNSVALIVNNIAQPSSTIDYRIRIFACARLLFNLRQLLSFYFEEADSMLPSHDNLFVMYFYFLIFTFIYYNVTKHLLYWVQGCIF